MSEMEEFSRKLEFGVRGSDLTGVLCDILYLEGYLSNSVVDLDVEVDPVRVHDLADRLYSLVGGRAECVRFLERLNVLFPELLRESVRMK